MFNPLTLLVGPCLVAYLVYKSTIPVLEGGYHLPWWYVIYPSYIHQTSLLNNHPQEHSSVIHGLAFSDPNSQAPSPSMVSPTRRHLRTSLYSLRLLLRRHENLCPFHITRGMSRLPLAATVPLLTTRLLHRLVGELVPASVMPQLPLLPQKPTAGVWKTRRRTTRTVINSRHRRRTTHPATSPCRRSGTRHHHPLEMYRRRRQRRPCTRHAPHRALARGSEEAERR